LIISNLETWHGLCVVYTTGYTLDTFFGHFTLLAQGKSTQETSLQVLSNLDEIFANIPYYCQMDITQFSKQVLIGAETLLYALASQKVTNRTLDKKDLFDRLILAEALSVCLRRIKEIDETLTDGKFEGERNYWVDVFWYVAELSKIRKNS